MGGEEKKQTFRMGGYSLGSKKKILLTKSFH